MAGHLAHIRTLDCIVCFNPETVAHHIRTPWSAGVGMKSNNFLTLPMCHKHHQELHNVGEERFWKSHNINQFEQVIKIIINLEPLPF